MSDLEGVENVKVSRNKANQVKIFKPELNPFDVIN